MFDNDCDYTRPGVAPWWTCCTETAPEHAHSTDDRSAST